MTPLAEATSGSLDRPSVIHTDAPLPHRHCRIVPGNQTLDTAPSDIAAFNFFLDERLATGQIQDVGQGYIDKVAALGK